MARTGVLRPGPVRTHAFAARRAVAALLTFAVATVWEPGAAVAQEGALIANHVLRTVPQGDIRAALRSFISFSERRRLGMHLGDEKGQLIEEAVRLGMPQEGPATVFEAGCHAGDGSLNAAAALLLGGAARPGSTIVSTEANTEWLEAAERVVGHATKGGALRFLPLELAESAPVEDFLETLRREHGVASFDAVILDHDEGLFLPYLRAILAKGLLRKGGTVYVDNVKRKARALGEYLGFVDSASGNGFKTEIKPVSKPYPDAVAISTYVGTEKEL